MKRIIVLKLIVGMLFFLGCTASEKQSDATKLSSLGEYIQISLSVSNLDSTLTFYRALGFNEIEVSLSSTVPWALITDGRMLFMLSQNSFPSPAITYYAKDMETRVEKLKSKISNIEEIFKNNREFSSAVLRDPNNLGITLIQLDSDKFPQAPGKTTTFLGNFRELSIPTENLNASIKFWENLGFKEITRDEEPFHRATLYDQNIMIDLYETVDFNKISLTYDTNDLEETMNYLENKSIKFNQNLPGIFSTGISFNSPDEQMFLIQVEPGN